MEPINFAQKQVRRISRNKILISLLVIIIVGGLLYFNAPPLRNLYVEPTEFTAGSELSYLLDTKERFVTTTAEYFFDTGYYITEDGRITRQYYAFFAEDTYVICSVGKNFTGDEFEYYDIAGMLKEPGSTENEIIFEIAGEIAAEWDTDTYEALEYIAPVILNINPSARVVQQIVVAAGAAVIIWMLINILRAIICIGDYTRAKQFEALSFGGIRDSEQTNTEVSHELEGPPVLQDSHFTLTRSFAIFPSAFTFAVKRKSDLLWFYKSITQHRTNGIPTGKTFSVTLRFGDGKTFNVASRKNLVDGMLLVVAREFPQALQGYDAAWEKLFNKDRSAFDAVRRDYVRGATSTADVD
ncbi:MAG: hypothetical protein LBN00_01475 [Oscillospiraceae bacterium]|jgi:hypothetical protein|nr:hypothetical protein [Oscillospiraceae bacterium]